MAPDTLVSRQSQLLCYSISGAGKSHIESLKLVGDRYHDGSIAS